MTQRVTINFTIPGSQPETLDIDVTISEKVSDGADLTTFPLESGALAADHTVRHSLVVALECVITNTPRPTTLDVSIERFEEDAENGLHLIRARAALVQLQKILGASSIVTINTASQAYEEMVLTALEIARDAGTGDALQFVATFTQIQRVETELVELPRSAKPGRRNLGRQAKTEAGSTKAEKVRDDSVFATIKNWAEDRF